MIYLTKTDPARNMARFYVLDIQPTLFGEWALLKEWGRIGRAGQSRRALFPKQRRLKPRLRASSRGGIGVGIPTEDFLAPAVHFSVQLGAALRPFGFVLVSGNGRYGLPGSRSH
jgi:predicted DNA-binding WGR domain protein